MKNLSEIITEMNVLRNRNNNLHNNLTILEDNISENIQYDKEQIITGVGLNVDAKSKLAFDIALDILNVILRADKPYGAFLYTMYYIYESIKNSSSPNASNVADEILKFYDTKAIDEIVSTDAKCKQAKERLEERIKQLTDENRNVKHEYDDVLKKIEKMNKKYPLIKDIYPKIHELLYFDSKDMTDEEVLQKIYDEYKQSVK
jgi:chromosome segregation ATPase